MNRPTVVAHYICDGCKNPIIDYKEGFHVKGNITLADPSVGRGLLGGGSWLDQIEKGERIFMDEIPEIVLCKLCFCKKLGISLGMLR